VPLTPLQAEMQLEVPGGARTPLAIGFASRAGVVVWSRARGTRAAIPVGLLEQRRSDQPPPRCSSPRTFRRCAGDRDQAGVVDRQRPPSHLADVVGQDEVGADLTEVVLGQGQRRRIPPADLLGKDVLGQVHRVPFAAELDRATEQVLARRSCSFVPIKGQLSPHAGAEPPLE
jgi:hypothetical protein